jgi:hypothetical protein
LATLAGFDEDLAAQVNQLSNRLRGLLTQIHPLWNERSAPSCTTRQALDEQTVVVTGTGAAAQVLPRLAEQLQTRPCASGRHRRRGGRCAGSSTPTPRPDSSSSNATGTSTADPVPGRGGLFPVDGRAELNEVAWILPSGRGSPWMATIDLGSATAGGRPAVAAHRAGLDG